MEDGVWTGTAPVYIYIYIYIHTGVPLYAPIQLSAVHNDPEKTKIKEINGS
jgi:hypothetical protein